MARVVELAGHPAGYAGRLLAEGGHDVIRVEPPGGDAFRRIGPYLGKKANIEDGAYHQFFNAGKRSLTLDTGTPEGQSVLLQLLGTADVGIISQPMPVDEGAMRQA